MRHTLRRLALVPVVGLTLSALVVPSSAGPDKIKYPGGVEDARDVHHRRPVRHQAVPRALRQLRKPRWTP